MDRPLGGGQRKWWTLECLLMPLILGAATPKPPHWVLVAGHLPACVFTRGWFSAGGPWP